MTCKIVEIINLHTSFAPIVGENPRTLILGTMPGARSLEVHEYYGHARNAFRPILRAALGLDDDAPYPLLCRALSDAGVAVWDVLRYCRRHGSLDSEIRAAGANDFAAFYSRYPRIRRVLFNGKAAAHWYSKLVGELPCQSITLPSTSPAYAAMPYAEKERRWLRALDVR